MIVKIFDRSDLGSENMQLLVIINGKIIIFQSEPAEVTDSASSAISGFAKSTFHEFVSWKMTGKCVDHF